MHFQLLASRMDEFYILFNSISVISGQLEGDNARLCAMEPFFTVGKISTSSRAQTRGRYISKQAFNLLSYQGSPCW